MRLTESEISRDRRPLVYVAGPYSSNPVLGVHRAVNTAEFLLQHDITPIVPHLTMLWDLVNPHDIEFYYQYDLQLLRHCEAMYRIAGSSHGADKEELYAKDHDIPVFHEMGDLLRWANSS